LAGDLNLARYRAQFDSIEGWFDFEAGLLFAAYAQLLDGAAAHGDCLEIGVLRGKSAVLLAGMRGAGGSLYAIDLFEQLPEDAVRYGGADAESVFLQTMDRFYAERSFLRVLKRDSRTVSPHEIGSRVRFCHIDGGHTAAEVYSDLRLAAAVLLPGGLLALDDVFNAGYPGVAEGVFRFCFEQRGTFKPLAVGFNKLILQRLPASGDLHERLTGAFPLLPHRPAQFLGTPIRLYDGDLTAFFDLDCSTARCLAPRTPIVYGAELAPAPAQLTCPAGAASTLQVGVRNCSTFAFQRWVGLSYHLLADTGETLRWDNARQYFWSPLAVGKERTLAMPFAAPDTPGRYRLQLDLIWEGFAWFSWLDLPPVEVELLVTTPGT